MKWKIKWPWLEEIPIIKSKKHINIIDLKEGINCFRFYSFIYIKSNKEFQQQVQKQDKYLLVNLPKSIKKNKKKIIATVLDLDDISSGMKYLNLPYDVYNTINEIWIEKIEDSWLSENLEGRNGRDIVIDWMPKAGRFYKSFSKYFYPYYLRRFDVFIKEKSESKKLDKNLEIL